MNNENKHINDDILDDTNDDDEDDYISFDEKDIGDLFCTTLLVMILLTKYHNEVNEIDDHVD